MNQSGESRAETTGIFQGTHVLAPVRAIGRFIPTLTWILGCYLTIRFADVFALAFPRLGQSLRRRIARIWIKGMPRLLGLRLSISGTIPEHPYFLVNNHISWLDFIAMNSLCDARCVSMDELRTIPLAGALVKGLNPIFVKRVRRDTPRVLDEMNSTLATGGSIQMAPEGVISPGRTVKRFRAALLESAVRAARPVHYASITYRSPADCPAPSNTVLFGPDPHYVPAPGEVSDEEIAAWGPRKTFFGHLLTLLSRPWTEAQIRFASRPILRDDAITLANDLQKSVLSIFTPLE
jgi:1-acyl-sn-glycerol-3-phosphate acyltransferase